MGLCQGMLVLHGLNLEIADAARRSGFNTAHQVALMDLIWSVRRIAFRHAVEKPEIRRPPKHPLYPDHYRPGHWSDNTAKRRKRGRERENEGIGYGTSAQPVGIEGDDLEPSGDRAGANSSAKRIKINAGQSGRHNVELPHRSKALNPVHPSNFHNNSVNRRGRGLQAARPRSDKPSIQSLNLPPRLLSAGPIFIGPRPLVSEPRDRTMVKLQQVGKTLKDNIDAIVECANLMKSMYEEDERLGQDILYRELEVMKGNFDSCLGAADDGARTVEKIISLLEDNKENAMKIS